MSDKPQIQKSGHEEIKMAHGTHVWTGHLDSDESRSFNISAVLSSCHGGEFGKPFAVDLTPSCLKHLALRELDQKVLAALPLQPARLDFPCIHFVENRREHIVDGVHRIIARHRLGIDWYLAWVLPEGAHRRFEIRLSGFESGLTQSKRPVYRL